MEAVEIASLYQNKKIERRVEVQHSEGELPSVDFALPIVLGGQFSYSA
jgi:hypothetical protein